MFDVAIYRKTAKGREEVASRAMSLSSRLRKALIMIDGRASYSDLKPLLATLGVPVEIITELAELGLIESDYDLPPMPVIPPTLEDGLEVVRTHSSR